MCGLFTCLIRGTVRIWPEPSPALGEERENTGSCCQALGGLIVEALTAPTEAISYTPASQPLTFPGT